MVSWWNRKKDIDGNNQTLSRRSIFGQRIGISNNGSRDLWSIFGYNRNRTFDLYYQYYRYNDVGSRVVTSLPKSCWRDGFTVRDANEDEVLENEIAVLVQRKLLRWLENADILNRIGELSVLYIGLPDGGDLTQPIGAVSGAKLEQVYFSAFSQPGVTITKYNDDVTSERYGLPEIYSLQQVPRETNSNVVSQTKPIEVHWSRVIHMAEGALDNSLVGLPALEPILNRLHDLNKTIGGAAEAYFRNARGKIAYKADESFAGFRNEDEQNAFREQAAAFQNNWQDTISLVGVEAKGIDTPHHDPMNSAKIALQAISGQTGIPIRILTGEGAGQLAGNEDKASYNQLISDRQELLCADWVTQIMQRLEMAGLIEWQEDFVIDWPELEALSENDKSEVRQRNANAFNQIAQALSSMALDGVANPEEVIEKLLDIEINIEIDDTDLGDEGVPLQPVQAPPQQQQQEVANEAEEFLFEYDQSSGKLVPLNGD